MSKLFDDSSLAMIPSAVKDGKLYSIRPTPEYGAEEVTNGNFATDSNWAKGGGTTISGGKANIIGDGSTYASITQNSVFTTGKKYRVSVDVVINSGLGLKVQDGATNENIGFATSSGTYVFDFTAGANTSLVISRRTGGTAFNSSVDNVSVKEITNSGDFTFSRGSNLAATRVDVNGLIEKGRENLLLQSNQFDTTWVQSGATLTSGQSGYDGSSDAWLLTKNASFGRLDQTISSSGVQTYSVYAKANDSDWIYFRADYSGGVASGYFDLVNGVGGSFGNIIDSDITSVGGGWYRIQIVFNATTTIVRIYPAEDNNQSGGTSGSTYIQNAQLESSMVATDYIETGASTAQAGILEDLPRLDYSGGASCPSLLLEPSRTNLLGQSEYYNVDYVKNQVTITDNAITSPEGLQNASKLIPDNGTGGNRSVGKAFTGLSGIHTFSTFAKAGEYGYVALRIRNAPSGFVMFDLNDGLIHYENNNAQYVTGSAKIEDYGNGWYRCSASFDPSGSVTAGDLYPSFSVGITGDEGGQWNGDGVSGIYIYGSQFEAGNYPTSYIPTMGSAVTRAYDYIKLIDLQSKGIITASQGTFLTELDNYNVGSVQLDVQSPNLDYALRSTFRFNHTDIFKRVNGVQTLVRQIYGSPAGRRIVAMSWNGTSLITSVNGVSYTDTIDGSIAAELSKIDRPNFNGTIFDLNRLLMFPTQLTEAELNALTTL